MYYLRFLCLVGLFATTRVTAAAQSADDSAAVLRLIARSYTGAYRIRVVYDSGATPALRAAFAAFAKAPLATAASSSLPMCSWVKSADTTGTGVAATLEAMDVRQTSAQAVLIVRCSQPGAAIGDVYWMRRWIRFHKGRGGWRVLPHGRVEVT